MNDNNTEADDAQNDSTEIDVGDVALDLAQGRPVHILEVHEGDAAEWSEKNNYDLKGNYANERLGTTDDDRVYEGVYCGSLKSEPSKTYAFPSSRIARIETEKADGGKQVAGRATEGVREEVLVELFDAALRSGQAHTVSILEDIVDDAMGEEATDTARDAARARRVN